MAVSSGEDAFKGPPLRVAHALAWWHPDAVVGTKRHTILQMQLVQFADKIAAVSLQAIGQHDLETQAPVLQFADEFDRQFWLRLVCIT